MKSRWIKTGIGSIIFLSLIAAVFLVLQPVYRGVSAVLQQNEQKLLDTLADKTGLGLSYKSLSPSILSGIHIKGIEVYDVVTKKKILVVDKAVLKYRLFPLLRGDVEHAFTGLSISSVVFDFDDTDDPPFKKKLAELIGFNKDDDSFSLLTDEGMEKLKKILFSLPFTIGVRNVVAKYSTVGVNASMQLNKITLSKGADGDSLSGSFEGGVIVGLSFLGGHTVGFNFSANGKLLRDISGSSAIFSIFQNNAADFSVSKSVYLLRYNDRNFVVRSLQNQQPFSLYAGIDLDSGDCVADVTMQNFYPLSTVKIRSVPANVEPFVSTSINASAQLSYNIKQKTISWHTDGSLDLSKNIAPQGERIIFDVDGENETITVSSLNAEGSIADIQFKGMYHIPTMQPSGSLSVKNYILPNGSAVTGDMYIDPLEKGFMCYIPQLTVGLESITDNQIVVVPNKDSVDFTVDLHDYAHTDFDEPGEIKIEGSCTTGQNKYLQASVSTANTFLDSVARVVASFVDKKAKSGVLQAASDMAPFVFTNALYVSTDFKSVSFNSPYSVIANTKKEKQLLLLSFDGNEKSMSVSQFDLIYGDQTVRATLDADISTEDHQVLFSTECIVNSLPYHLKGNYQIGTWLELTGDYGFDTVVTFGDDISGTVQFASLPIAISKYILSATSEMHFTTSKSEGFALSIDSFELEDVSGSLAFEPKVAFTGRVNSQGFVVTSISYTDKSSSLDGSGEVFWNINDGMFDSLSAQISMQSPLTPEKFNFSGNFTNPMRLQLNGDHLMNDCYSTADMSVASFPLSRVMSGQLEDDTFSAQVNASGTVRNPFVSVNMTGFSMQMNGSPLIAKGIISYEDGSITIPELEGGWSGINITRTTADFDISHFSGKLKSQLSFAAGDKTLYAPFEINIDNLTDSVGKLPDSFAIELKSDSITGTLLNEPLPVQIICLRTPKEMTISSSPNLGVSGKIQNDGTISFSISDEKPLHGKMDGKVQNQYVDFDISNVYCDLKGISFLFNSNSFALSDGIVTGNMHISGLGTDPELNGAFKVDDLDFNLPNYIPEHMKTKKVEVTIQDNKITVPDTVFEIKNSALTANLVVKMDRLSFSSIDAKFKTARGRGIPIDVTVPLMRIKGTTDIDAALSFADNTFSLEGSVGLNNSEITAITNLQDYSPSSSKSSSKSKMDTHISLELLVGQRVQIVIKLITNTKGIDKEIAQVNNELVTISD